MTSPLGSLIECGTKLWLDSVDPDLTVKNRKIGATRGDIQPDHRFGPDQDRAFR